MGIKRKSSVSLASASLPQGASLLTSEPPELYQVIAENAPDAIKSGDIKNHFGRKVAIVRVFPNPTSRNSILAYN